MKLKCAVLDANGRRCNSVKGVQMSNYHGDNETYGYFDGHPAVWVTVPMCAKHDKYRHLRPRVRPGGGRERCRGGQEQDRRRRGSDGRRTRRAEQPRNQRGARTHGR